MTDLYSAFRSEDTEAPRTLCFITPPPQSGSLRDDAVVMQIWSFVCLSPTRTCRVMARLAQQRNSADGRERPQRCWATRTTSVPDAPPVENLTLPREIYASGGDLLVTPSMTTKIVVDKFSCNLWKRGWL